MCSFNCTGLKSSVEYVTSLCDNHDIVALQETWLLPHDIPIVDAIHRDHCAFATSSVDVGAGVVRGRPYGGLAFMYRRNIETQLTPINLGEDRLLGLLYKDDHKSILFLNVYMPTQCNNNYDLFVSTLGRAVAIIHEQGADAVCLLGDFNARPNTPFYDELQRTCTDNGVIISDVAHLPATSYTHVSDMNNSTSWLDHVLISENLTDSVQDFNIAYGNSTSNHFPVSFNLTANITFQSYDPQEPSTKHVKWSFDNANLFNIFRSNLDDELVGTQIDFCNANNCKSAQCKLNLNIFYDKLCTSVITVGEQVFGTVGNAKFTPIPGWNDLVRDHHVLARDAFLAWRAAGSPREGDVALRMRAYRAQFKLALRECRASEERLRTEAMATQLASRDVTGYWSAIRKLSAKGNKITNKLDNCSGPEEISQLWQRKYQKLFNSVDPHNDHKEIIDSIDYCDFFYCRTYHQFMC